MIPTCPYCQKEIPRERGIKQRVTCGSGRCRTQRLAERGFVPKRVRATEQPPDPDWMMDGVFELRMMRQARECEITAIRLGLAQLVGAG